MSNAVHVSDVPHEAPDLISHPGRLTTWEAAWELKIRLI